MTAQGGWYGLLSIIKEAKEEKREIEERPPMACPNDGEPLLQGPRGTLYCRFDGWRWPDDWHTSDGLAT